jgi:transposase
MISQPRWFAGVDWASQKHQVCLLDAAGKILGERQFVHSGAGLAELCGWLVATSHGQPADIAVAIEVSHGPIVEILLERGFAVNALNPKQLDRFRDRFTVAGAKDDRRDAYVAADALRTDPQCFRTLALAEPLVVELRAWSRLTDELQHERTRLTNRMRDELWRYYPQALQLTDDFASDWFLALWQLVPTPDKARRLRESSLAQLLKNHHVRRITAADALRLLRQPPLVVAPGTTEAACAHIRSLIGRLAVVNRQLRQAQTKLDTLSSQIASPGDDTPGQSNEPRDAAILLSLPGVGRIVLATLLAEAAEPLKSRDYNALRALSGVAPVTRQSGKRTLVVRRLACQRRLRDALYHWARTAAQFDPSMRQRYNALRQRGHSHNRALRTIGDRLLAIACAMLRNATLYDPQRYHQNGEGPNQPSPLRTRAVIGSPACTAASV